MPFYNAQALTWTPIRMEIAGDPGETLSQEMTLINERDTDETYYASYANFEAQGESGSPSFVDDKEGISTWIETVDSVVLPANSSKIIQVKIDIPNDADPGGHFGVVFWGTQPPNADSGNVVIGAKMGMLLLLRVNGEFDENGNILEFATIDQQKFFTSLPVSFYYRFQNSGGDRIKPEGDIKMQNFLGITSHKILANPVEGNILPSSIRKIETTWKGKGLPASLEEKLVDDWNFFDQAKYEMRNFALGYYKAKMNLEYGTTNETATASFSFWVLPWHLLILVLIAFTIILFIGKFGFRRYKKMLISKIMHGDYGKIETQLDSNQVQNNSEISTEAVVKKPTTKRRV